MVFDKLGRMQGISQDDWKIKFRDRLLNILKEKNMSQSELARISGLSASRVSDYIKMKSVPTIFAAVNMADALNMSIEELIGCDDFIHK